MARGTVQPFRRNSALYRVYDDLILWLKFENNFDDSSFYYQQVTGHNPDLISPSVRNIELPPFDKVNYYEGNFSAGFNLDTVQREPEYEVITPKKFDKSAKDPIDGWIKSKTYKYTAIRDGKHTFRWEATISEGSYYIAQRILKNSIELEVVGTNGGTIIKAGNPKRYDKRGNYCSSSWPENHCPRDYKVKKLNLKKGDVVEIQWGAGCCCGSCISPEEYHVTFIPIWNTSQIISVNQFRVKPPTSTLNKIPWEGSKYQQDQSLCCGESTFLDSSSEAHSITPIGDVTHSNSKSKFGSSSIYFDGNGDWLSIPDKSWDFGEENFTVECFFYVETLANNFTPAPGSVGLISSMGDAASTADNGWVLGYNEDGTIFFNVFVNETTTVISLNKSNAIQEGQWHHIAAQRASMNDAWGDRPWSTATLWLDGQQVDSDTIWCEKIPYSECDTIIGGDISYGHSLAIGRFYTDWNSYYHKGYIDEIRISQGPAKSSMGASNAYRYDEDYNSGPPAGALTVDSDTSLLIHSDFSCDNTPSSESCSNCGNPSSYITNECMKNIYTEGGVKYYGEPNKEDKIHLGGEAVLVSGTGVFTTDPQIDSAAEFDLAGDFCFEFWAKFNEVPSGTTEDPGATLFDFGDLKFTNTSGFFTIHTPEDEVIDYYEKDFAFPTDSTLPSMTNTFTHYAVQRRADNLELWMGHHDPKNNNNTFMIRVAEENVYGKITGLQPTGTWKNARSIGATISGTNFFSGWMDDFKVWKTWIYGPEPVIPGGPEARGIYITPNPRRTILRNQRNLSTSLSKLTSNPIVAHNYAVICKAHEVMLWCTVRSVYDPRWSVHRPLPYEILWYKDGHYLGSSAKSKFSARFPNANQHFTIGKYGAGELLIRNFQSWSAGTYTAVIKIGPPGRPKYIFSNPQIVPARLFYRNCFPTSCFGEGTRVLLYENSHKKIEELIEGKDTVLGLSHTESGDFINKNKVQKVHKRKAKRYYKVTYEVPMHKVVLAEKTLKVTEEHPFYIGDGKYAPIKDLNVGDILWLHIWSRTNYDQPYQSTLYLTRIKKKELIEEELTVYNLTVDGSNNYFAGNVAVHNKSPRPPPRYPRLRLGYSLSPSSYIYWNRCPSIVQLGQTVKFHTEFWYASPSYPIDWRWINPGRGNEVSTPDKSTLEFTNIRKSIKSPIAIEAEDANGTIWTAGPCSIKVKLPDLLCPEITSADPNRSTRDLSITYPFRRVSSRWYSGIAGYGYPCGRWWMQMTIIPDQTSITLPFSVDAVDPMPAEMNTGGLKYEWRLVGYQYEEYYYSHYEQRTGTYVDTGWSTGTKNKSFYILEYFSGTAYCRVSYNNYPINTRVQDPEGRYHYGPFSQMEFSINFPECEEPYAQATESGGSYYSGYYGGYSNDHRYINTSRAADGTEIETSVKNLSLNSCQEMTFNISCYLDKAKCLRSRYTSGKGYTNDIEITTGSNFDSKTTTLDPGEYMWNELDMITFKKKFYMDDNGTFLEVKLKNECGERILRWNFKVVGAYKIYIYPNNWSLRYNYSWHRWYSGDSNSTYINFYYQERIVKNWYTGSVEKYKRYIPDNNVNLNYRIYNYYYTYWNRWTPYNPLSSCRYYRVSVNGNVVGAGWQSLDRPIYYYYYPGGGSSGWCSNGICYSYDWAGPPTLSLTPSSNYWQSYINILVNRTEGVWPQKKNVVLLELVNNVPNASNISGGQITSHTIYVNFETLPTIQSWTLYPRWGWWYCGYYYWGYYRRYRRAYWWYYPYCYWWGWGRFGGAGGWKKVTNSYVVPQRQRLTFRDGGGSLR
jgi:hypothetical protein